MIKLCKDNFGDTYCLAGIVGGNYQDHYYIRNSNGKIFMLSVAIEGTDAYDFQERERKENYTKVVFDKTFHQDCYGERYVVFDELPSNTPKYSKGHLDNNFVIEINKKMGSMPVPNIILNRYDLRYTNDDIYWVHIQEQLRSSTVGLRIHANRAWIGILRMPISPNCLEEMIRKVFSVFPAVHNISFQFTRFNPKLLWPNALFKESSFLYIQLPESHEALFARTSGHFRRRIKYERRRIERAVGSIRIERYATSEIPLEIIQLYVQYKSQKYDDKDLHRGISGVLNGRSIPVTHCYVLRCNNDVLAIILTSEDGTDPYLVNLAYNPQFAALSPGKVLYIELLKSLIDRKKKILYLGSGEYEYKHYLGAVETAYWVGDICRDDIV